MTPVNITALGSAPTLRDLCAAMDLAARQGLSLAVDASESVVVRTSSDWDGMTVSHTPVPIALVLASRGTQLCPDMLDGRVFPFGYEVMIMRFPLVTSATGRTAKVVFAKIGANMPLELILDLHAGTETSVSRLRDLLRDKWGSLFEAALQVGLLGQHRQMAPTHLSSRQLSGATLLTCSQATLVCLLGALQPSWAPASCCWPCLCSATWMASCLVVVGQPG